MIAPAFMLLFVAGAFGLVVLNERKRNAMIEAYQSVRVPEARTPAPGPS